MPIEVIVPLLMLVVPLVALAKRFNVPYPIVLVAGGIGLALFPRVPSIVLDPDLILVLALPPLLYWESITAPTGEMQRSFSWIAPLAFGLVAATALAVAAVVHAIVPAVGWAVALALGAILGPTDEVAIEPIAERLGVPRRTFAIIEGESLINDASALVLYATAIGWVSTGHFSWTHTFGSFVIAVAGSIALGIAIGILAVAGWRTIKDVQIQTVIAVLLPYLSYLPAERMGISGVLAVVATGLTVNRFGPGTLIPTARLRQIGFWETLVFIVNATIFLLVGLQLRDALPVLAYHSIGYLAGVSAAVTATVIATRFAWVFGQAFLIRSRPPLDWKQLTVIALCGLRGGVSMAAALAIPATLAGGEAFPHRELLIFITFVVIVVTLVGGGMLLPLAIRFMHIAPDAADATLSLRQARLEASNVVIARLAQLQAEGKVRPEILDAVRRRYQERLDFADTPENEAQFLATLQQAHQTERSALVAMGRKNEIDNTELRQLLFMVDSLDAGRAMSEDKGDA